MFIVCVIILRPLVSLWPQTSSNRIVWISARAANILSQELICFCRHGKHMAQVTMLTRLLHSSSSSSPLPPSFLHTFLFLVTNFFLPPDPFKLFRPFYATSACVSVNKCFQKILDMNRRYVTLLTHMPWHQHVLRQIGGHRLLGNGGGDMCHVSAPYWVQSMEAAWLQNLLSWTRVFRISILLKSSHNGPNTVHTWQ